MQRFGWIAFVLALSLLTTGPAAHAEKRVALVIGNSAYRHTPPLANPKNDAIDFTVALKRHGFRVIEGFDLDKAAFDRKVLEFATALEGANAGLFFFAGHGLQVSGHNYLVPVDAELKTAAALDFEMVRLDVVQRVMEHQTNTNVLFLDACRDNPLARNLARAMGTRSGEIGRGFSPVVSGVGTLISFSTQPGNVALDGTGRNSPFAGALVKHVTESNGDLSDILIDVRNDVMKDTQNKQVPWEHSALRGHFYFSPPAPETSAPVPPAPQPRDFPDFDFFKIDSADLQVSSVDDLMTIYVNGRKVEEARFGETPPRRSILPLLKQGPNAITVDIYNGKYGGCGGILTVRINQAVALRRRWEVAMKDAPYEGNCAREVLTLNLN